MDNGQNACPPVASATTGLRSPYELDDVSYWRIQDSGMDESARGSTVDVHKSSLDVQAATELSYDEFVERYMVPNRPVLIQVLLASPLCVSQAPRVSNSS
jgi:hypothetical protein